MKLSVYGNTHFAWVTAAKLAEKGNLVTLCVHPRESSNNSFDAGREWLLPELLDEQKEAGRLKLDMSCRGFGSVHLLADNYTESSLRAAIQPILASMKGDTILLVLTPLPVGALQRIQRDMDDILIAEGRRDRAHLAA